MNITIEDEGREIADIQSEYIAGLKKQIADLEEEKEVTYKRIYWAEALLKDSQEILSSLTSGTLTPIGEAEILRWAGFIHPRVGVFLNGSNTGGDND